MIIKMGNLAHSADVRASRVEAAVPGMIEQAIEAALASVRAELVEHHQLLNEYGVSFPKLTSRVELCENEKGDTEELTAIKANIAELKKDVDTLKSTDVQMLWGDIEINEPSVETTPQAPSVQPSRAEAEDEEVLLRSSDDEVDEEREKSVDQTF